jgi:hypothetical protein
MVIPTYRTFGYQNLDVLQYLVGDAYALNWFVGWYRGKRRIFHEGDVNGMHALVEFYPEEDVG